jgi:hypothetical protein
MKKEKSGTQSTIRVFLGIQLTIRVFLGVALVTAIWFRVDWTVGLFAFLMLIRTEIEDYFTTFQFVKDKII